VGQVASVGGLSEATADQQLISWSAVESQLKSAEDVNIKMGKIYSLFSVLGVLKIYLRNTASVIMFN